MIKIERGPVSGALSNYKYFTRVGEGYEAGRSSRANYEKDVV